MTRDGAVKEFLEIGDARSQEKKTAQRKEQLIDVFAKTDGNMQSIPFITGKKTAQKRVKKEERVMQDFFGFEPADAKDRRTQHRQAKSGEQ
jgi:hypothetical protein